MAPLLQKYELGTVEVFKKDMARYGISNRQALDSKFTCLDTRSVNMCSSDQIFSATFDDCCVGIFSGRYGAPMYCRREACTL